MCGLFAFRDAEFLGELGLAERGLVAWEFVYRNEGGATGLNRDENGLAIWSWLLRDAVVIGRDGSVTDADKQRAPDLWPRVHAASSLTISQPDESLIAEARRLADYRRATKLNALKTRYGRGEGLSESPILLTLFESAGGRGDAWTWLIEHCAGLCIWDRFTEFGVHPTMIRRSDDQFDEQVAGLCERLHVPFQIVGSAHALPAW